MGKMSHLGVYIFSRSLYNKINNFRTLLHTICPDFAIVSETWGRVNMKVEQILSPSPYKAVGFYRPKVNSSQPGGGCELVYNPDRFNVFETDIIIPKGVEVVWRVAAPKQPNSFLSKICICSIYVSPKSRYKETVIEHVIETIHLMRSKYDNCQTQT